jgi:hypothetical protein
MNFIINKNKFIKTFDLKLFTILAIMYAFTLAIVNNLSVFLDRHSNSPISDSIISNIPTMDFSFIFVFGFFIPQFVLFFILLLKKNFNTFFYFYFIIGMFTFTRLIFNMMTHLQAPADAVVSSYFPTIFFENDLFFSGHVGVPFLFYLFFKKLKKKYATRIFLAMTILMAVVVLFMKVHYTIDVFSAPFITFGVFYLSDKFLRKYFNLKIEKEFKK